MKIAVIGSNGRVGKLIVEEALNKGINVTAIAKGENMSKASIFLKKDALDLTKEDLSSFDAVVDAVGGWDEKTIPNITHVMIHLADVLSSTNTRLLVVGGAGSLFVDEAKTITVDMGKDFPESWKPLSNAHGAGLKVLREAKNLNWTYISPACNFVADGKKTNAYKLGGENLILSDSMKSEISYADYALALVEELIANKHNKERIGVVSKE